MKNLDLCWEIQAYCEKIEQEISNIDDLRYEIGCLVNHLEHKDADLLDRFMKLESAKEVCHRALISEPVAIWAELHRLGI